VQFVDDQVFHPARHRPGVVELVCPELDIGALNRICPGCGHWGIGADQRWVDHDGAARRAIQRADFTVVVPALRICVAAAALLPRVHVRAPLSLAVVARDQVDVAAADEAVAVAADGLPYTVPAGGHRQRRQGGIRAVAVVGDIAARTTEDDLAAGRVRRPDREPKRLRHRVPAVCTVPALVRQVVGLLLRLRTGRAQREAQFLGGPVGLRHLGGDTPDRRGVAAGQVHAPRERRPDPCRVERRVGFEALATVLSQKWAHRPGAPGVGTRQPVAGPAPEQRRGRERVAGEPDVVTEPDGDRRHATTCTVVIDGSAA
jgi:hypothetical protein